MNKQNQYNIFKYFFKVTIKYIFIILKTINYVKIY